MPRSSSSQPATWAPVTEEVVLRTAGRRAIAIAKIWPEAATALSAWFIALLFVCFLATPFGRAIGQSTNDPPVLLIDIKGAIGFVAAGQLAKALEHATAQGSPAVIVRLDTPGGLLSSTREMIHTILASRIPIVMYVAPNGSRAASAGTYLMYASHVAAMAPGTHLGAATPIALSPSSFPGSPPSKPSPESDKESDSDPRANPCRA
jgi:membrane-bound serine protease (ClpP class)